MFREGCAVDASDRQFEAKRYEGKVEGGHALISVHSEDNTETQRAKKIFEDVKAEHISTSGESSVSGNR